MNIIKIDPPCWFTGMKHHELQLLVYGTDLKKVKVTTTIPHQILNIYEGATSHSLFIDIILTEGITAGTYVLYFKKGEKQQEYEFQLHERRNWSGVHSCSIDSNDVIYLLMPDRFAIDNYHTDQNKKEKYPNEWHGGTLKGICQQLQYLEDLGVTALWLTPVLENNVPSMLINNQVYDSYHGYSITDFYTVDPHFGTLADYQQLVREAHTHGLKIIADLVFNHCSHLHCWMKYPPSENWFKERDVTKARKTNYCLTTLFDPYVSNKDRKDTIDGWFTDYMPDLNLQSQQVWQYLTQMSVWWIETAGIDAIRMDTFLYADAEGMWKWLKYIDNEYPGFSILAEAWVGESAYTAKVQCAADEQTHSKAPLIVMDFAFREHMLKCFGKKQIYAKESMIYNHFVYDFLYPHPKQTLAFLDNHDTPRWFSTPRNLNKQKQALALLLTLPRIPQLFYGTEIGLTGDNKGTDDGNYRQDFFSKFETEKRTTRENDILHYTKVLLHWRKKSRAICWGSMKHFIPQQGVYVFFRIFQQEKIMVIANLNAHTQTISLSPYMEELTDVTTGVDIMSKRHIDIHAMSIAIQGNQTFLLELT